MAVLCYCCVSMAQQVISSGGYEVKSEVSVNWILGGSLSDIAPIDPNVLNKLRKDEMMESRVRNGILDLTGIEILPKFVILTKMDNPKDAIYAESTVIPLFHDIADFMLRYYQVPKER